MTARVDRMRAAAKDRRKVRRSGPVNFSGQRVGGRRKKSTAGRPSLLPNAGVATGVGGLCTTIFLVFGTPLWVGLLGAGLSIGGLALAVTQVRRDRANGVPPFWAARTEATTKGLGLPGHDARCRARSARTCRCPKNRKGSKR